VTGLTGQSLDGGAGDQKEKPMYEDGPREPEHSLDIPVTITVMWDDAEIQNRAARNITAAILEKHEDAIKKRVFNGLDDIINGLLLEVMEREVTLTDRWGKPLSNPTTIQTLLQQSTEDWLTQRVDSYGRSDSDSYGSKKNTRAEYLFKEATKDSLQDRVKAIIVREIGNLDDLIAAEVKTQLRRTIK
jgi:hypothetical protein